MQPVLVVASSGTSRQAHSTVSSHTLSRVHRLIGTWGRKLWAISSLKGTRYSSHTTFHSPKSSIPSIQPSLQLACLSSTSKSQTPPKDRLKSAETIWSIDQALWESTLTRAAKIIVSHLSNNKSTPSRWKRTSLARISNPSIKASCRMAASISRRPYNLNRTLASLLLREIREGTRGKRSIQLLL